MNKRIFILMLISIWLFHPTMLLRSQQTFVSRKKSAHPIDISSLNARNIKGNTVGSTLTGKLTNSQLKNSISKKLTVQKTIPDNTIQVIRSKETNLPIFIHSSPKVASSLKSTSQNAENQVFAYLDELKDLLQVDSPRENFKISHIGTDGNGKTHVRLEQIYKGIEVYGADAYVHLNQSGLGEIFNGRYKIIKGDINIVPVITEQEAFRTASAHLKTLHKTISDKSYDILPAALQTPVSKLVIYKTHSRYSGYLLSYHLTVFTGDQHRWEYFIDAHNGKVIGFYENTCYADGARTAIATDLNGVNRTVNTYQIGSFYYMLDASRNMFSTANSTLPDDPAGAIITIDLNNTWGDNQSFKHVVSNNNIWNNPTAVSANYNAGFAYEYYRQKHDRNSIDGNGGTIWSIINVPDLETGEPLDNAFWNGRFMCYGNGAVAFKPLAGGLDVAGHEMTHGVVENTANLVYEGESGAINESMADIFGAMMDSDDWLIGEDVVKPAVYTSGALRSLSDPHNGGSSLNDIGYQPRIMSEKYTGSEDNYGVHTNSGIPNYAFYLFATAIGKEKAAGVYYKALNNYLTKSSQFIDLRLAVIQAATDIYGSTSEEVSQAGAAFDAVGITNGQSTNENPTLPVNPGDEFVLVYNTDNTDVNTLYRSTLDKSVIDPLTTSEFLSRPSVTDDGSVAVFVAGDNTLHSIITAPNETPDEYIIQNQPFWSNVVVSKDGNRIAAVTTDIDTSIFVYDFVSEQWAQFTLYTPTYTQGIQSAGPLYADALEFDYTGEYLVFDVFNRLENTDGSNIEYWDVNFIRVWNNDAEDFGDGTIFKLFSSIPDNVSIGNPAFSKNSPDIIAFDYLSSNPEEYYILGCNIETGNVDVIAQNNTIGWPSFNKDDSRLAFSTINTDGDPQIDYVFLNSDKITSDGNTTGLFSFTKWPVYFSTGTRIISSVREFRQANTEIQSYPNPFSGEVTISLPEELSGPINIEVMNYTGQIVYSEERFADQGVKIPLNLKFLKPGYYLIRITNNYNTLTTKILKQE